MKIITDKIIENAARDYTEQQTGLDYIGESEVEKAFKEGAKFMKYLIYIILNNKE